MLEPRPEMRIATRRRLIDDLKKGRELRIGLPPAATPRRAGRWRSYGEIETGAMWSRRRANLLGWRPIRVTRRLQPAPLLGNGGPAVYCREREFEGLRSGESAQSDYACPHPFGAAGGLGDHLGRNADRLCAVRGCGYQRCGRRLPRQALRHDQRA